MKTAYFIHIAMANHPALQPTPPHGHVLLLEREEMQNAKKKSFLFWEIGLVIDNEHI